MQDIKQSISGAKLSGFILLLGLMLLLILGVTNASILIFWIFLPVLLVSFVLFLVFIYKIIKHKVNLKKQKAFQKN
jgi:Flp pilus assembly protein TadB